jgi:hypothetical protein
MVVLVAIWMFCTLDVIVTRVSLNLTESIALKREVVVHVSQAEHDDMKQSSMRREQFSKLSIINCMNLFM